MSGAAAGGSLGAGGSSSGSSSSGSGAQGGAQGSSGAGTNAGGTPANVPGLNPGSIAVAVPAGNQGQGNAANPGSLPASGNQGSLANAAANANNQGNAQTPSSQGQQGGLNGAATGNANIGGNAGAANAPASNAGEGSNQSGGRGLIGGAAGSGGLGAALGRKPSDVDKRRTQVEEDASKKPVETRPNDRKEAPADKPDTDKANAKPETSSGEGGAFAFLPGQGNRATGGRINKPVRIEGLTCKLKNPKVKQGGRVALEGEGFDEKAIVTVSGVSVKVRSLSGTKIVVQLPKELAVGGKVNLEQGRFVASCGSLEIVPE